MIPITGLITLRAYDELISPSSAESFFGFGKEDERSGTACSESGAKGLMSRSKVLRDGDTDPLISDEDFMRPAAELSFTDSGLGESIRGGVGGTSMELSRAGETTDPRVEGGVV